MLQFLHFISSYIFLLLNFFIRQNLLVMSGILILIAITTSSMMFLIALGFAVLLYGLILKLYLRTAQDLKRLEGISKFFFFTQLCSLLLHAFLLHISVLWNSFQVFQCTHYALYIVIIFVVQVWTSLIHTVSSKELSQQLKCSNFCFCSLDACMHGWTENFIIRLLNFYAVGLKLLTNSLHGANEKVYHKKYSSLWC